MSLHLASDLIPSIRAGRLTAPFFGMGIYAGQRMDDYDLSGLDLRGLKLSRVILAGADFSGTDLRGTDLSNANLYGANFTGATLGTDPAVSHTDRRYQHLLSTDLRKAYIRAANFIDARLDGSISVYTDEPVYASDAYFGDALVQGARSHHHSGDVLADLKVSRALKDALLGPLFMMGQDVSKVEVV